MSDAEIALFNARWEIGLPVKNSFKAIEGITDTVREGLV
jgi:hypothetical protein